MSQKQIQQNKTIGISKSPATERENVINLDQKINGLYTKSSKLENQFKNSNTKGENMLETNKKNQNNVNEENQDQKSTNKSKNNFDSKYFSYVIRNAFVKEVNEKNSNKHINISLNRDQKVQVILNENAFVKYLGDKTFAVKMNDVKEIKGFSRSLSEPGKWRYEKMNSFSLQSLDCVQIKSTKELDRKSSKDEIKETVVEQQTEAINVPSFVFDEDKSSETSKNQNETEKTM